jgi:transcription antitermination factor NusA-like protein
LEQIASLISCGLRLFSWTSRRIKLKAVTAQIESQINLVSEAIESEVQDVMPHPVKIEWITSKEEHATLAEGQVVVRLRDELDNARNVVTATMLYLQAGFLRESRSYTDQSIQDALDLKMAWRLLGTHEESDIAHYFLNELYNPIVLQDKDVETYCGKLGDLDTRGVLTRVHIRELRGIGRKVTGKLPEPELREETRNFTDFLHTIVTSEKGALYPLEFLGKTIKIGIQLVARHGTLIHSGLRFHRRWFKNKVRMGVETIYVLATGRRNVDLARHHAQWAQRQGLAEIVRGPTFVAPSKSGEPQPTVVITCHSAQARADWVLDPEEEIQATLVRHIPEVALGHVEVLDIVREVGIQTTVVVRSTIDFRDPLPVCIGKDKQHIRDLVEDLQEDVWFVPWSDDPETFLINCLRVPHDEIHSVNIRPPGNEAEVVVKDSRTAARAIGTKGSNVKLAGKITGLRVQILTITEAEESPTPKPALSPEEDLRAALIQHIPEIAAGTIEIVDIFRDPGIQSQVVVRNVTSTENPIPICLGENYENIRALREETGELVWFVAWSDDPETFLINCLGIHPSKVSSVEINPHPPTAKVVVEDKETCARAVGENGVNVKQAAQLTQLRRIQVRCLEDME